MPYVPTGEQTAILGHDYHRHARVLAGPGTGKSATVVALVDQLLAGKPAPRIKLITFTRAATAELAKKVSDHPAAAAQRPSTMHSFSISVLLRNPGPVTFHNRCVSPIHGRTTKSSSRLLLGGLTSGSLSWTI